MKKQNKNKITIDKNGKVDSPMLRALKKHMAETSPEQFKKEWAEVTAMFPPQELDNSENEKAWREIFKEWIMSESKLNLDTLEKYLSRKFFAPTKMFMPGQKNKKKK